MLTPRTLLTASSYPQGRDSGSLRNPVIRPWLSWPGDAKGSYAKSVRAPRLHHALVCPQMAMPIGTNELHLHSREIFVSLQKLSAASVALPASVPPEIIDYIEDGRNPDIYTREFVELVQKNNMYLKGKSEACRGFRDVLAEELVKGDIATQEDVRKILESRLEETRVNGEAFAEAKG